MLFIKDLESDYYQINGTQKVLYWNGNCWMKPVKDRLGKHGFLEHLEKQPTNVKTVEIATHIKGVKINN